MAIRENRRRGLKMKIRSVTAITVLLYTALLAAAAFPVVAQETPSSVKSSGEHVKGYDDWNFSVGLNGWLPSFQGDITGRGKTAQLDVTLDDVLDFLFSGKVAFTIDGRFEVSKGPWGFYADVEYVKLNDSLSGQRQIDIPIFNPPGFTIRGNADVIAEYSTGEAALSYDVYASPCLVANMPELIVEVLAGARYQYLRTKVDLEIQGPRQTRTLEADKSKNWVDPFVGGRVLWRPGTSWITSLETDFGGFTVSSDFTFNIRAEAVYRINKWFFANAGYRALYTDYETGSGNDRFAYDMWVHGPFFGVGVEF
jgi:hypothetical protein